MSSYDLRRPDASPEIDETSVEKFGRRRSPSLPPIYKQTYQQEENCCDGEEGETSGYASDSGDRQDYQPSWSHKQRSGSRQLTGSASAWHLSNCLNTPDSLNSEGGRLRWGDKGVGVGHLWDASLHNPEARLPSVTDRPGPTPPAWLCRATNNTVSEVLVISHPEVTSPVTEYGSCDTVSNSDRSFLRGQNVCIDSEELLERERKRQKAKELQNAIRQQLEEREKKRKEEKEKRLREERLEEERLLRQQEIERIRLEEELRKQREKELKEEKKEKAMKEALEHAERLAREEKMKSRKKHKSGTKEAMTTPPINATSNEKSDISFVDGSQTTVVMEQTTIQSEQTTLPQEPKSHDRSPPQTLLPLKNQDIPSELKTRNQETTEIMTSMEEKEKIQDKSERIEITSLSKSSTTNPVEVVKPHFVEIKREPQSESSDDIEPDSLDEDNAPSIELVLGSSREIDVNQLSLVVSTGRLLTPTKFRTNPSYEKSTQTEHAKLEREAKLPLRKRLEERPKWGVNRPETQYIKQSERDPYYQSRARRGVARMRAKNSKPEREDSRSPSPISMKIQGSQAPVATVSRGTITPRVMQMVVPASSASPIGIRRSQYLAFKGGVGAVIASGIFRQKAESKPLQPQTEMTLVKDVLNQLTSLRQGLSLKQQEWDVSRSQTPFSEISSFSTSA